VTAELAQRVLALAAASMLAAVIALAVSEQSQGRTPSVGPRPALGTGTGWYRAFAGVGRGYPARGKRSPCGWLLRPGTLGVVHPVLPCGAKVFVEFGGKRVYTEIVERAAVPQREELALTPALAEQLGLKGVREIRWAFARN
jgi:hypothetical protein